MKYVLDASVAFKWEILEVDTDKARRLRDDWRLGIHEFHAPDVFPVELIHSITRAERQRRITTAEGADFAALALFELPHLHDSVALLPRAYEISSSFRIGVYDGLYVALAEREGCEFVTADARISTNLAAAFPFIVLLSTLP
jgi:predicted nucleic acid-binding protein